MSQTQRPSTFNRSPLRPFFAALQFLTRIPVPASDEPDGAALQSDLRRGLVYFPLIGAGIGALTASVLWGCVQVVPFAVAVLLALVFEAVLTGAFHEDAVADFCDAFGGGWSRDDVLRILKDSRVGSFGVLGLGLAVALRATGLIAIGQVWLAAVALVVAGALGRLVAVALMASLPSVTAREGLSQQAGADATWSTVAIATLLIAPVIVLGTYYDSRALALAALVLAGFIVWFQRYLLSRIRGVTGDCAGFAAYAGIVITTLAFARLH